MNNSNKYLLIAVLCCAYLTAQDSDQVDAYAAETELVAPLLPEPLVIAPAPLQPAEVQDEMKQGDSLVNIGLEQKTRASLAHMLNTLLADEYSLYVKTQKFHWNIVGPFFGQLHKLFNDQFDQLAEHIDKVAERTRALGFPALGTFAEFAEYSLLNEHPGINPDAIGMIKQLLEDHEMVIRQLRGYINDAKELADAGTENFLAELIVNHEKMAWMLRAHLL